MARLVTKALAQTALSLASASIQQTMDERIATRHHLHAVIIDATSPKAVCLAEKSFGDKAEWEYAYDEFAHAKALLSVKHRMSTREIQEMHPALLQVGDTTLYGSVYKDGIVVACSGVQSDVDEGFAGVILALLLMLIQLEAKKQRSTDNDYYQLQ